MKLIIGTTFNTRIYNDKHQTVVESVKKYYPDTKFYVYHENSFDAEKNNESIDLSKIDAETIDIFKEISWFENFLKNSPFKDCHTYGKPKRFDPPNYWKRNSIFWFRKVAAIHDCLLYKLQPNEVLLWLGADTYFNKPLDNTVLNYIETNDISCIKRKGSLPETDIIFFNKKKFDYINVFAHMFVNIYRSLHIFQHTRWDDCQAFELVMNDSSSYINYGGLSKDFGAPFDHIYSYIGHYKDPLMMVRDIKKGI